MAVTLSPELFLVLHKLLLITMNVVAISYKCPALSLGRLPVIIRNLGIPFVAHQPSFSELPMQTMEHNTS